MRTLNPTALFIAHLALAAPVFATPIATVNGVAIDKKEVDQAITFLKKNNPQVQDTPAVREEVKERLINRELILQEAKRRGLEKSAEVHTQIQQATSDILQDALFADILKKKPISDAQIQARYKEIVAKLTGTNEVHALQITVKTEAEAKNIIAELKKGAHFEKLAKARSLDPNAKDNGGDMGYGNLSMMPPNLAQALQSLKPGQISQEPFQSNLGWHVFKVIDTRPAQAPSLEQIRGQIIHQLQAEEVSQAVKDLRSRAKIQ